MKKTVIIPAPQIGGTWKRPHAAIAQGDREFHRQSGYTARSVQSVGESRKDETAWHERTLFHSSELKHLPANLEWKMAFYTPATVGGAFATLRCANLTWLKAPFLLTEKISDG